MVAGSMSQREAAVRAGAVTGQPSQNLPPEHPPIAGGQDADPQQVFAQVQAAMKQAKEEPNNFEAQFKAAQLEYQIQNYDKAIEFLLKANKINPDHYGAIASLGMINMDAGHFDEAEKWYRKALAKKADDEVVLDGLCHVLLSARKTGPAEDAINQLEKVNPTNQDLPQFRDRLAELKSAKK
jgi:predicted Zn-dependent protease